MIVTIQIDTNEPLSDKDLDLLHQFTGLNKHPDVDFPTDVERAAAEAPKAAPAKKAAAKKAAPAKKAEPEDETDFDALRAAALAKAGELLADGKRDLVTGCLAGVDAGRVSEIDDDRLQEFIDSLDA